MPICPGCNESVSYDRIATHERYCSDLYNDDCFDSRSMERLERRVEVLESRLESRITSVEELLPETSGLRVKQQDE